VQVTALDATVPYSEVLEQAVIPDAARIVVAVQKLLGTRAPA
jgi:pyruvate/2-oxoglutarate/acetoin dehydrogenase E1 component